MNIVTRNLFNKNGVLCGCSADTYSHVLCEWPIKDGPSGNVVEAQGSTVEQCEMVPFFGLTSIRLHLVRVQTDYPSPNCLQLVAAQETFAPCPASKVVREEHRGGNANVG